MVVFGWYPAWRSSKSSFVMVRSNLDDFAGPNRCSSWSASPIHLSTRRNKVFANSHSNVRVVRSITRFDRQSLSYALVRSNCNKLVMTWPLGCLADLSPSWPCYNYYFTNSDCSQFASNSSSSEVDSHSGRHLNQTTAGAGVGSYWHHQNQSSHNKVLPQSLYIY